VCKSRNSSSNFVTCPYNHNKVSFRFEICLFLEYIALSTKDTSIYILLINNISPAIFIFNEQMFPYALLNNHLNHNLCTLLLHLTNLPLSPFFSPHILINQSLTSFSNHTPLHASPTARSFSPYPDLNDNPSPITDHTPPSNSSPSITANPTPSPTPLSLISIPW